jgi:hypothetical protein
MNAAPRIARKSLADQIDRLDQILDGLAEGINETVTSIVHGAVKDAVQAAVTEVLTNAELQKCLRSGLAIDNEPDRPAVPSFGQKIKDWVGWIRKAAKGVLIAGLAKVIWVCSKVGTALKKCWTWATGSTVNACQQVVKAVRRGWARMVLLASLVKQFRRPVLLSVAVGVVVGLGCYFAGPGVAAAVSGLNSVVLTWVAWLVRHVWRLLGWGAQEPDGMT